MPHKCKTLRTELKKLSMRTILAVLFVTAGVFHSESLTLDQCIDIALKKSPDIVALQNDYESGKAKGYYALLQTKNMEKVSALASKDLKHLLESVKARKEQGWPLL